MRTQDFDFSLPEQLIAQHPTSNRGDSKLLHLDGKTGIFTDANFQQLPDYLSAGDLIIFNDTRVIKARLFGKKSTGGAIELMVERVLNQHEALAYIKASRAPKPGATLDIEPNISVQVINRIDNLFHVRFLSDMHLMDLLDKHGNLPLPPYIEHQADTHDEQRYQTVFAKHAGAVAAPTAGLHFDDAMLDTLKQQGINIAYITLHVGAGTFQPVKVDNITDHKMHSEHYHLSQDTIDAIARTQQTGGKIIAVGTTVLRTLESAAQSDTLSAGNNETDIFITPGYQFQLVDKLLTNFHLPKSTLLMLVSAFAGYDHIKAAYQHAIAHHYRFFSYGDAMLLEGKT